MVLGEFWRFRNRRSSGRSVPGANFQTLSQKAGRRESRGLLLFRKAVRLLPGSRRRAVRAARMSKPDSQ